MWNPLVVIFRRTISLISCSAHFYLIAFCSALLLLSYYHLQANEMTKKRSKNVANTTTDSEDLTKLVSELRAEIDGLEEQHRLDVVRISELEQQIAAEREYYRPRIAEAEKLQLQLRIRQALCCLRANINQDLYPGRANVRTWGHQRAWNDAAPERQQFVLRKYFDNSAAAQLSFSNSLNGLLEILNPVAHPFSAADAVFSVVEVLNGLNGIRALRVSRGMANTLEAGFAIVAEENNGKILFDLYASSADN